MAEAVAIELDPGLSPSEDETLDALLRGRVRLLQPRRGARVSLDALLLSDFVLSQAAGAGLGRVVDLGCGGGVVALALAASDPTAHFTGVELQPALVALARRNTRLNDVEARVDVKQADLTRLRELELPAATYDHVVSNPPFFAGDNRRAPTVDRALARQEIACTLGDVALAARRLLRPRGKVSLVFPAGRLPELVATLEAAGLRPKVVRSVHSVAGEPARRVLVQAVHGYRGDATLLSPLVVHEADRRTYTPEAGRILGDA